MRWINPIFREYLGHMNWVTAVVTVVVFIGASLGLAYVSQHFLAKLEFPQISWMVYLIVFVSSLIASLSILVPVPVSATIMIAAATAWNPIMVALSGSAGSTIGELSSYYVGYMGKKMVINPKGKLFQRVDGWIKRYGTWAILALSLQPFLPFDIAGLVAGAAHLPLPKFLLALGVGKVPKNIIFVYAGTALLGLLPPWLK